MNRFLLIILAIKTEDTFYWHINVCSRLCKRHYYSLIRQRRIGLKTSSFVMSAWVDAEYYSSSFFLIAWPGHSKTHFPFAGPSLPVGKHCSPLPARPVGKIIPHLPALSELEQTSNWTRKVFDVRIPVCVCVARQRSQKLSISLKIWKKCLSVM